MKLKLSLFVFYMADVIFHNCKLMKYNEEIKNLDYLAVMLYNDGASWRYLMWSIILIVIGLILIYFYWRTRYYWETDKDLIITFILALLILISFIFTILIINNPILQSACVVIIAIGMGVTVVNS